MKVSWIPNHPLTVNSWKKTWNTFGCCMWSFYCRCSMITVQVLFCVAYLHNSLYYIFVRDVDFGAFIHSSNQAPSLAAFEAGWGVFQLRGSATCGGPEVGWQKGMTGYTHVYPVMLWFIPRFHDYIISICWLCVGWLIRHTVYNRYNPSAILFSQLWFR